MRGGSKHRGWAQFCGALVLVALSWEALDAKPAGSKPVAAEEYTGHVASLSNGMLLVHIDSYTPDDAANAVALAGHGGDSSAIRTALGRLDAGFIKLGVRGYRIAYARRRAENDGVRIILIIRNELEIAGRSSMKEFVTPPLAAVDVWLPSTGEGQATISCAATVVFRSADDIAITDWGDGTLRALDLRARSK